MRRGLNKVIRRCFSDFSTASEVYVPERADVIGKENNASIRELRAVVELQARKVLDSEREVVQSTIRNPCTESQIQIRQVGA